MYISLPKKIFTELVTSAAKFVDKKNSSLPVLSCIVLSVEKELLTLQATNLETTIILSSPVSTQREGECAVPASVLREVALSYAGEGTVTLEVKNDSLHISSSSAKSTIKTISPEDFPKTVLDEENRGGAVELEGSVCKNILSSVVFCASTSLVRPELASVLFSQEGGVLTAVATDSFRLAEKKVSMVKKSEPFSILIPAKNTADIISALPDETVFITPKEHQCVFSFKNGRIITRLVSATYPDYAQIIPKSFTVEVEASVKDFESALRKVSLFSDSFQKVKIMIEPDKKEMVLFAEHPDVGNAEEHIPIGGVGDGVSLSFNHRYLHAPLPFIKTNNLSIKGAGVGRPILIQGAQDNSFLYLVMPMTQ